MPTRYAIIGLVIALLAGCSAREQPWHPVRGKVRLNGKPLTCGTVIFYPNPERGNLSTHEPRARINAEGEYQLAGEEREGAPAGCYRVAIFALKHPNQMRPPEWVVSPSYSDPKRSGLEVEVRADPAAGAYDFDLKNR
jgi:hypothetical protein